MIGIISYAAFFLTEVLVNFLTVLGLNVQWGFAGLFNVGVAGFVGIGAYVSALLTVPVWHGAPGPGHVSGLGLPVLVGWAGAALASAAAAAVVGLATLRLRADYLAIGTFGIAVALQEFAANAQGLTGGAFGIALIPHLAAAVPPGGLARGLTDLAITAAAALAAWFVIARITAGPFGRALRALAEDEDAAASLGCEPRRLRVQAMALGAAVMGLAGAVQASLIGYIAPDNFLPVLTFQVWAMLVVGGVGSHRGALLGSLAIWGLWSAAGAAFAIILPSSLAAGGAPLRIVAIGVVIAASLLWRPRGLSPPGRVVSRFLRERDSAVSVRSGSR